MKGSATRSDAPTEGARYSHNYKNPTLFNAHQMFRKAVDYLKQCFEAKERCTKLLTTKGNFLTSMTMRSEMTGIQVFRPGLIVCTVFSQVKPISIINQGY